MPFTDASLRKLESHARQFWERNEKAVQESLALAGNQAISIVDTRPGFKRRTGRLQEGTKARIVGGRKLRLTNNVSYAPYIEYGRGWVYPKKAKYLRFKVGGRWVSAKKSRPSKPYKFLYRAHRSAGRVFENEMRKRMRQIASSF